MNRSEKAPKPRSRTVILQRDFVAQFRTLSPEVDYQALLAQLPGQSHPRRKLAELQRKGHLIRLKKGFYVFTKEFIGREYSTQIVANLMYGPSYLSLESALQHYRLIPERVEVFSSVTTQKNKIFETAIGRFTYSHLHPSLYPLGITISKESDGRNFLIAKPEKALLDIFTLKFRNSSRPSVSDLEAALENDLRVELTELKPQLDYDLLNEMRPYYKYRPWCDRLIHFLTEKL